MVLVEQAFSEEPGEPNSARGRVSSEVADGNYGDSKNEQRRSCLMPRIDRLAQLLSHQSPFQNI